MSVCRERLTMSVGTLKYACRKAFCVLIECLSMCVGTLGTYVCGNAYMCLCRNAWYVCLWERLYMSVWNALYVYLWERLYMSVGMLKYVCVRTLCTYVCGNAYICLCGTLKHVCGNAQTLNFSSLLCSYLALCTGEIKTDI